MESELHSINGMRNMEVIDIISGSKIGFIRDFKIDTENNKVISLLVPGDNKNWFGKEDEKEILWKDIVKIGLDVILVNMNKEIENNNNVQLFNKKIVIMNLMIIIN